MPLDLFGWSCRRDAVADALETAETLDVETDEAARPGILIANDRRCRFEVFHPRQAGAFERAADVSRRHADLHGDVFAGRPLAAQRDDPCSIGIKGLCRTYSQRPQEPEHDRPGYDEHSGRWPLRGRCIKAAKVTGLTPQASLPSGRFETTALKSSAIDALEPAREFEKLLARFPKAQFNPNDQRQLRASLYRPLIGLPKDVRAGVVDLIMADVRLMIWSGRVTFRTGRAHTARRPMGDQAKGNPALSA